MRSCADEFIKISLSRKGMTVAQSRKGRRPMRVATMLRKEKEGTLYKFTKAAQTPLEKKQKGDVPTRADVSAKTKIENRTDVRSIDHEL